MTTLLVIAAIFIVWKLLTKDRKDKVTGYKVE